MNPTSNFPSISGTQQQSTSTAQPPSNDGSEGASGSFVQHKVDISKYSKPMVLKYLCDNARGQGPALSHLHASVMALRRPMNIIVLDRHIEENLSQGRGLYFDYVDTIPLKVDVSGSELDTTEYDRYHGDGCAARAIAKLETAVQENPDAEQQIERTVEQLARAHNVLYPEESRRFDQALADVTDLEELTQEQLLKVIDFGLYGKGDGKI